ncbi:hypothetical protein EPR50_G00093480 [Perca flavescens]|uniref:Uncharacterized protein n=1 Tax=Perca flavescens TaxID=8167 RepID=A0A484CYI8_PERFV|nr:hypothetical protein EPR50_G00093480 [Perca flavescens]
MKPCPLCRVSYANRSQHLRDVHCVADRTERRLMLGMASGRYAGPLGCPATPCHGRKYIRLDRHLTSVHKMTKEDIKLTLEESRRKEIASQLSALRETKQQAGSASQRPAPKKHQKDFEYLIAMFEKRNFKRDKRQLRSTVKNIRRFVRHIGPGHNTWQRFNQISLPADPPPHRPRRTAQTTTRTTTCWGRRRVTTSPSGTPEDRSSSVEEGSDQDARQALQSRVAMDSTETASLPHTLIPSEDRPFLPPVVIQRIIEETLSMDMVMLGLFNRVSKTSQELAKPFCPSIYINDSLAGDLNLQKDSLIHISVGKIYKTAGSSSGLALRLKSLSNRRNWLSARLVMRHVAHSRYLIEDVSLG